MKKRITVALLLGLMLMTASCERRDAKPEIQSQSEVEVEDDSTIDDSAQLEDEDSDDSSLENEVDTQGAEKVVDELMAAMQSGNSSEIGKLLDYNTVFKVEQGQSDANMLAVMKMMQYDIQTVDVFGETGKATIKFTNVDVSSIFSDYIDQARKLEYDSAVAGKPASEQDYINLFEKMISDSNVSLISKTVELPIEIDGEIWRIIPDDSFVDAALGGYFSAMKAQSAVAQG